MEPEGLGRTTHDSGVLNEGIPEELPFQALQGLLLPHVEAVSPPTPSAFQDRLGKVFGRDQGAFGEGDRPLHRVLQLPDVPPPVVAHQMVHGLWRDPFDPWVMPRRTRLQKMCRQEGNVLPPLL